ncbi:MAG: hypothetical protein AAGD43_02640 [Pseudomonadota bacterium]
MIKPSAAFEAARSHMSGPFELGKSDCCVSVLAAFDELHGSNLLDRMGWRPRKMSEVLQLLRRYGTYGAWVDAVLQLPRAHAFRTGDLALIPSDGPLLSALALRVSKREFVTKTERGSAVVVSQPVRVWTWHS